MTLSLVPLAVLVTVCVGMPVLQSWRLLRLDEPSRAGWLIMVADASALVGLVAFVGRWDIAGLWSRPAVLAVFLGAVSLSWRRHARRPWRAPHPVSPWRRKWPVLVSAACFGGLLTYAGAGAVPSTAAVALQLPLDGGWFVVGHGGANPLLNHHAGHRAQNHAVDILAVDGTGFRAAGLLPPDLARYVVFDAEVVSPCDGRVVKSRDGLPDRIPPDADAAHPAGNHVVLSCGTVHVELAHLRNGSLSVAAGDPVTAGDPIGRVGNSGNTTEPHLHVHAVDPETGRGVPMLFDGRAPFRNRLFAR